MATRIHVNNYITTLNGAISNSDTTAFVTSATGLPALTGGDFYYLTLVAGATREIVKVTARTTTNITIVRAQEGTTAVSWADGSVVSMRTTADSHDRKADHAATSTDKSVPRHVGTNGKVLQDSGVIIDDSNNITGVNSLTLTTPLSAANGGTGNASYTANSLLYASATTTINGVTPVNSAMLVSSAGGVPSWVASTGSGAPVRATTPTLVTPVLGVATATSINFGISALANYDEGGSFTPTFTFATPGNLSVVYTTQTGYYTRIGNCIFFRLALVCTPTFTTASGDVRIGGLPFTVSSTATSMGGVAQNLSTVTHTAGYTYIMPLATSTTTYISLRQGGSALPSVNLGTAGFATTVLVTLVLNGQYFI